MWNHNTEMKEATMKKLLLIAAGLTSLAGLMTTALAVQLTPMPGMQGYACLYCMWQRFPLYFRVFHFGICVIVFSQVVVVVVYQLLAEYLLNILG
jgi:hypothetical protein